MNSTSESLCLAGDPAPEQKNILIYFPTFSRGGMEKNAVYAANLFVDNGYCVKFVYARSSGGQFEQIDSRVCKLRIGGWLNLPLCNRFVLDAVSSFLSFLKILFHSQRSNTLVLSFQSHIMAVLAAKIMRRKIAVRISSHPDAGKTATGWLMPGISARLKSFFYKYADVVISNSEENSECYGRILGRSVRTVANPVLGGKAAVKSQIPLHPWLADKKLPVVVSAGRFSVEKNFEALLEAFGRVVDDCPSRLIIFGDGVLRDKYQQIIVRLGLEGSVSLPGFVDNSAEQFSCADLFVLTSLYEGLPNALIEALAAGCPAVSVACHSGPKEILLEGEGGDLVPQGDLTALAEAIRRNLSDKQYSLAKLKHAQTGLDRFSEEKVNAAYLALTEEIIG